MVVVRTWRPTIASNRPSSLCFATRGRRLKRGVMQIKFSDGKDLARLATKLRRSPDDALELL
jgi:hypothetical protein